MSDDSSESSTNIHNNFREEVFAPDESSMSAQELNHSQSSEGDNASDTEYDPAILAAIEASKEESETEYVDPEIAAALAESMKESELMQEEGRLKIINETEQDDDREEEKETNGIENSQVENGESENDQVHNDQLENTKNPQLSESGDKNKEAEESASANKLETCEVRLNQDENHQEEGKEENNKEKNFEQEIGKALVDKNETDKEENKHEICDKEEEEEKNNHNENYEDLNDKEEEERVEKDNCQEENERSDKDKSSNEENDVEKDEDDVEEGSKQEGEIELEGEPEIYENPFEEEEEDDASNPLGEDEYDPLNEEDEQSDDNKDDDDYDPLNDFREPIEDGEEENNGFLEKVNSGKLPKKSNGTTKKKRANPVYITPIKKARKRSYSDSSNEDDIPEGDSDFMPGAKKSRGSPRKRKNTRPKRTPKTKEVVFKCTICTFNSEVLGELNIHKYCSHKNQKKPGYLDMAEVVIAKLNDKSGSNKTNILKVGVKRYCKVEYISNIHCIICFNCQMHPKKTLVLKSLHVMHIVCHL